MDEHRGEGVGLVNEHHLAHKDRRAATLSPFVRVDCVSPSLAIAGRTAEDVDVK